MRLAGTKYCPSCGQDVQLEASLEGAYLLTSCANCGLGLGLKVASGEESALMSRGGGLEASPSASVETRAALRASRSVTPAPVPLASPGASGESVLSTQSMEAIQILAQQTGQEVVPAGQVKQMRSVFVVEDSGFLRQVARDLLTTKGLARDVVECSDGPAFLEEFVRAAVAGRKPDLVVLDVRMPEMDGRDAATAMRAVEVALGVKRTPILFFSAVLCDEPFKQMLEALGNAKYVRKADGGDPQQLGERIVAVLERLVGVKR
jgi:CheY-like chemotaxis protein